MTMVHVTHLPSDLYQTIERSIPIVCVDLLLTRHASDGMEVGLIKRRSPFGEVWCHLGGRVHYGETIRQAIDRHLTETVGPVTPKLDQDPQPNYVYQWFPEDATPPAELSFGRDPRKHSVALSFAFEVDGTPAAVPGGEALQFAYWPVTDLPEPLWPGCEYLFSRLI
jgi:ADP-ribose pyrophosphatase YjhB (NUDIX family)